MGSSIAVVGGGVAGAGVAYGLRNVPVDVTVFERDEAVGGRTATRRRDDCVFDYGANYVHDADEQVVDVVERFDDGLVDVTDPVWTFDADGTLSEGEGRDGHRWTYRDGIDELPSRLVAASGATVETDVAVDGLVRHSDSWQLADDSGHDLGTFDGLVLTPPAPLTADLLGRAEWPHDDRRTLRTAIESVPYRTVVSVVLHYPFAVDRPFYALVTADKDHDVWWLSREECKDGHVPAGECLLVAQLSADWSAALFDRADDAVADRVSPVVADLLDDGRLADPDWTDVGRFRYAQPEAALAVDSDRLLRHDLYLAGDWLPGEGRVHAALTSGLEAAATVTESLGET
ncbi:NAD(P)/FAD-dependent oxidoreductase [Halobacteriales archaeon Cl-PHB]